MTDPTACPDPESHNTARDPWSPCLGCGAYPEKVVDPDPFATPTERFAAAHRALEDALATISRAHADVAGGTPGILVDWVVVTATHLDLGDGQSATDHGIFGPIEGASYRAVGLLETGRDRLRFALNTTDGA